MKLDLFIFSAISCIAIVSCSQDDAVLVSVTPAAETPMTSDDLLTLNFEEFKGWDSSNEADLVSRASVNVLTLRGCTSLQSGGNEKIFIRSDLANLIGISSQTYILEHITAYQYTIIPGLGPSLFFAPADSPLCGVDPSANNWAVRGYTCSSPNANGEVTFTSKCLHIISDMSGRSYNIWYPCKPDDFLWNYNLVSI